MEQKTNLFSVNMFNTLVNCILPMYAEDAHDMVLRIIQVAKDRNEDIDIEDGFDLYRELSEVRKVYAQVLPG